MQRSGGKLIIATNLHFSWFQINTNYFQKRTLAMIIYSSQVQFAITFAEFLLRLCRCETKSLLGPPSLQNEAKVTMLFLRQKRFAWFITRRW